MTGKCKDCRHWLPFANPRHEPSNPFSERDEEPYHVDHQHRVCAKIRIAQAKSYPENSDEAVYLEPPLAFTQDASGYFAALWVASEFGCLLWEGTT